MTAADRDIDPVLQKRFRDGMTETAGSTRHERRRPDKIEEMLHISFHRNFSFI